MDITEKTTKPISEISYLNTQNTSRYRPIMRLFYRKYEKIEYWLYKEDVFRELSNASNFDEYTLELCESDLESLVEWGSLTKMQDTSNASTIEEFKNRKFRYQLTEYAVEIERLVLKLEDMHIETASLEPKLFDRIRLSLEEVINLKNKKPEDINEWWVNLNKDFTTLNQNYQDFLKKFNEAKTEELMKSRQFLLFKQDMISYLKEFIKGFQNNSYQIEVAITKMEDETLHKIMNQLIEYQRKVPRLVPDFDFDYLKEVNIGKWASIKKWFIGSNSTSSEASKLLSSTNNIINKITKYAASIIEIQGNTTNRKDEYKHICSLFGNMNNIKDAHTLSSVIFGVTQIKHFTTLTKETDNVNESVFNLSPTSIALKSRSRMMKEKSYRVPIISKFHEKERQYKEYMKQLDYEKSLLSKHIQKGYINLDELDIITNFERRFILKLITKAIHTKGIVKDNEYGTTYQLIEPKNKKKVKLVSDDGTFELNNYTIIFGCDRNE